LSSGLLAFAEKVHRKDTDEYLRLATCFFRPLSRFS
jgi:hypothetical protein